MPKIRSRAILPYVVNPALDVQETINFKEDVSKLSGRHAFKMGYDVMRLRRNQYSITNNAGTFTLDGHQRHQHQRQQRPQHRRQQPDELMSGAVSSYSNFREPAQHSAAELDPRPVLPG